MPLNFNSLDIRIDGPIAEIFLDRPDSFNSFDDEMHREVMEAFLAIPLETDARAILFGARGRVFSAGGNFDMILRHHDDREHRMKMSVEARLLLTSIGECPLPVITALQGDTIGLGATLILASDAIVAARTARISDPHVVIGLTAGDGGCVVWPLSAGLLRAKRYLLSGDRITAEVAHGMGLVTDLVDTPDEVVPAARAIADRIAALPPLAVQHTKRALNQIFRQRMDAVFDLGMALEMDTFTSDDMVEAVTAFKDKRVPSYKGH